jgi:thioredoxin-like negative regulator of GroEL
MRISIPRFLLAFAVAVVAQAGVFAWYHSDLLYLRRPVSAIVADDAAVFAERAGIALARPKLTRQHLDTIASAAKQFGQSTQEIQALERRLAKDPADMQIKLRLADALRRRGDFNRAEALYQEVLAHAPARDRKP